MNLCCGAACVRPSAPPLESTAGHSAVPLYPVAFLRARRPQPQRLSKPLLPLRSSWGEKKRHSCWPELRWRITLSGVHVIPSRRRLLLSSRLIFQRDVGDALCARRAPFSRGRLTKGGDPGSLFILCSPRNKRSLHAKGGLSRQGEAEAIFSTLLLC